MKRTAIIKKLLLSTVVVMPAMQLQADSALEQAITEQVQAASDCEDIAYGVPIKGFDPAEIFSSCVETRAILIAMLVKYGVGNKGEINAFEKVEAYNYLTSSQNDLVRQEANRYATAAGR